ncbi:DUF1501 domain-containing protein [Lignipirellula cremea]|uniref:Sulfatase n=1 Tax=Lignipirellula cremea TaxID=2528010 RepID=A0A518E103_9BACT|nr:DUF1501 domain-containing protein [Lignipirellula cremea]QDU97770.1 hypothetical protein Pla8534_56260 [Lignipirellula cremea]
MNRPSPAPSLSRRQLLQGSAAGFGWLAAASLLAEEHLAAAEAAPANDSPLAARPPHFPAKAKRIIFLFMKGGPSQIDTFDYKPLLERDHGKPLPFARPRVQFAPTKNLLKSPWKFQQHGDSGLYVSELFPHTAKMVDELCILSSLHGTNAAHGGALLKLHTGSDTFVRPSMGSWINYGLGTENQNLPGFVTICPTLAHGGVKNWGSAFLPAAYQGTPLGNASMPSREARVRYSQPHQSPAAQRLQLDLVQAMNSDLRQETGSSPLLEARINAFELAFRMQAEMPSIEDLSDETAETLALYGLDDPTTADFGRQCLLARRFSERGVRFVQATHSNSQVQWDQHAKLQEGHSQNALEVDRPIAGLLADLKRRGQLEETLVLWGGEFGRTPTAQGNDGRDHNPEGFTVWLAGAGVKKGIKYGATDDYGYFAVENKVHIHDLHATLLHLLGLDHEKLTYRYAGRDFRLTDVHGRVAHDILS